MVKELDGFLVWYVGSKPGTSPVFNISSGAPARKAAAPDDFLNSEGDKNDYEWYFFNHNASKQTYLNVAAVLSIVSVCEHIRFK